MPGTKKIPQRQCIGCGQMKDKKELIRILKTPENEIKIDTTLKKNGRGAYICKDKECLVKAIKQKGLERSFKMAIDVSIYDELKKEFDELGK